MQLPNQIALLGNFKKLAVGGEYEVKQPLKLTTAGQSVCYKVHPMPEAAWYTNYALVIY